MADFTVQPVFLVNNNLPAADTKPYTVSELCGAAERISGINTVEGAQRIRGLWRLYPRNEEARTKLLVEGLILRGNIVSPRDLNPFTASNAAGATIETTKLIISDVPMSCPAKDIKEALEKAHNLFLRSAVIDERDRDDSGKLTRWKTGRRFVYIEVPKVPLPKIADIGIYRGSLFHKEQRVKTCNKCLEKGHHASVCTKAIRCRQCLKEGHRQGDTECDLAPPMPANTNNNEATTTAAAAVEVTGIPATVQTTLQFGSSGTKGKEIGRGRSRSCVSKRPRSLSGSSSPARSQRDAANTKKPAKKSATMEPAPASGEGASLHSDREKENRDVHE